MREPCCFYDDTPASATTLFLVDGLWLCPDHARCAECKMPLVENIGNQKGIQCTCNADSDLTHEDLTWCSLACLEVAHHTDGKEEE